MKKNILFCGTPKFATSSLQAIFKNQEELNLSISQYIHSLKNLNKIIEKSVEEAQITEEVLVRYKVADLHISKNKEIENSTLLFKNRYRGLRQNFSLNLKPFIAAREDFIKAALLLEHDAEFIFSENLFDTFLRTYSFLLTISEIY